MGLEEDPSFFRRDKTDEVNSHKLHDIAQMDCSYDFKYSSEKHEPGVALYLVLLPILGYCSFRDWIRSRIRFR